MATDYYLVISGVPGDVNDLGFSGAFSVSSFEWQSHNSGSAQLLGSGQGVGKAYFDALQLTLNSETVAGLLASSASGQVISNVSLVGTSFVNGKSVITSSINLADVVVGGVAQNGNVSGIDVTLNYGKISVAEYDNAGHRLSTGFNWDAEKVAVGNPLTTLTTPTPGAKPLGDTQAGTYYLLVDGVNGGSTDPAHLGWFELKDFNIDVSNTYNPQTRTGGPSSFGKLSVTTQHDTGLSSLLLDEAQGKHLTGVRVEGVDYLGRAVYDLDLNNILVTSVNDQTSAGDSTTQGYDVSFDYNKMSLVTKGADAVGKLSTTGSFGWDVPTKTSIDPTSMAQLNAGTSTVAAATTGDYYLVISGVPGDVNDLGFSGAFSVSSFEWQSHNSGSAQLLGSGQGVGKAYFDALQLTLNSETVAGLLASSASGQVISNVSLVGTSFVNGKSVITSSINLADVVVGGVAQNGNVSGIDVTLNYGKISVAEYDNAGHRLSTGFNWDAEKVAVGNPLTTLTTPTPGAKPLGDTQAGTYYLLVDGVNGGSTDPAHLGWFELKDFNIDVSNTYNPQTRTGGPSSFGKLSVTTQHDTGLSSLLLDEAQGKHLTGVRVEGVDYLGRAVYDLDLNNILVTSVNDQTSAGDSTTQGYNVTFDYNKMSLVTKGADAVGKLSTTGSFGWDVPTKTSIDPTSMAQLNAGTSTVAAATTGDYYLVISGVPGDVNDLGFSGAFSVSSFEWQSHNSGSAQLLGSGQGVGKAYFDALQLTLNSETVAGLLASSASGQVISNVSLVGTSFVNGKSVITSSINLADVVVGGVAQNGNVSGIDVTLNYGKISVAEYDNAGHRLSTGFNWDAEKVAVGNPLTTLTTPTPGAKPLGDTQAGTYYLLVDGVNGGSTDPAHLGWFELKDFNIDVSNTYNPQTRTGGPSSFGKLSVTTQHDTGLSSLLLDEAQGKHLTGVRVEGVDYLGRAVYDLDLNNILVTSVNDQTSAGDSTTQGYNVTFDYNKMSLVTKGADATGKLSTTGSFGWDVPTKTSIDPTSMAQLNAVMCFCAGTLIRTIDGEVPVQNLEIGDLLVTADGCTAPIRWIGHRKVSTLFMDPLLVLPIRIKASALADNVPCRDLLLSPEHAVLIIDVLIQAGALVNGASIIRESNVPQTFTYYHVELDDHSLILAENTPAETFIDNVDRLGFDNWEEHEALYFDGKSIVEMPHARAKAHRQVPRLIRELLAARAVAFCEATSSAA